MSFFHRTRLGFGFLAVAMVFYAMAAFWVEGPIEAAVVESRGPASGPALGPAPAKLRRQSWANTRILFIGNSYTYYAKLPRFLIEMTARDGAPPTIETRTGPGMFLADHFADPQTLKTIDRGTWDIIILQGQSLASLEAKPKFLAAGRALAARAQKAGARVYLFETWARRKGHDYYQQKRANRIRGPKEMQHKITRVYAELAKESGAEVLEIGQAMTLAATSVPSLRVFDDDGSHPSLLGAKLGAMVIYAELTSRCPPSYAGSSLEVKPAVQLQLQRIVGRVTGVNCD